jgi:site-specific recombinase XerD
MATIAETFSNYLDSVKLARSENTHLAYSNAIKYLGLTLESHGLDVKNERIDKINEEIISWFAYDLKSYSAASEQLYLTAVKGYLEFLVAENLTDINLSKVKLLIRQRARKPGKRLPQFPAEDISRLISLLENNKIKGLNSEKHKLRALRDKAFLITLADTGLRVHEACKLRRGDVDWNEGKALVIGKGNTQAVVRFSKRSQSALRAYLRERSTLDGKSGRQLGSLPLFSRHDKGAGAKLKPITPTTGRNIVSARVKELLGDDMVGTITPHSFRHYFVTRVLAVTGNLKLAQNLARHKNIAVTQRYAHLSNDELDKGYWEVFEE